MPKILEINGYKFYIYTNDHLPIHVHVVKSGKEVKVVLVPEVLIKDNHKFKIKELKRIIEIIEQHYEFIIKKWHETHH